MDTGNKESLAFAQHLLWHYCINSFLSSPNLPKKKFININKETHLTCGNSGKSKGGGVCLMVNNKGCSDVKIISMGCSLDLERLMIRCQPYYLPQEFALVVMTAVYVPPHAYTNKAIDKLYGVNRTETSWLEAAFIVAGVKKAEMRVSTSQLQQLTIFTTVLTGGGTGTMYYLMQKKFAESDYYRLAIQKLEACSVAMESLGAPPLKVHNIHLTDRNNRVDQHTAQIKIPVTGSKTGGYLYTTSFRDSSTNRWNLKQAVLKLGEGQTFDLLSSFLSVSCADMDEGNDMSTSE